MSAGLFDAATSLAGKESVARALTRVGKWTEKLRKNRQKQWPDQLLAERQFARLQEPSRAKINRRL